MKWKLKNDAIVNIIKQQLDETASIVAKNKHHDVSLHAAAEDNWTGVDGSSDTMVKPRQLIQSWSQ